MWLLMHPDVPGSFHFPSVISYSNIYPIITSSSFKSGLVKQLFDNPQPQVFEIFHPNEDYEAFWKHIILPLIHDSHEHQYIYYSNKPTLPLPVSFAPPQHSIELVHKLILNTDINLPKCIPFPHYIDYPPHQSASILIAQCLTAHGFFSLNIPGCFVLDDKEAYLKGDILIVALGLDTHLKVVIEGVIEVGRHFILYEVQEVGLIPIGCVQTTQLVVPLNSHLPVFRHFLVIILMAFFPCFFQSSAIFGKLGRVPKEEDPFQSQFSDLDSVV
jgi:hypothetical protein